MVLLLQVVLGPLYLTTPALRLNNCHFDRNSADYAGAIYLDNAVMQPSDQFPYFARISMCNFTGNTAILTGKLYKNIKFKSPNLF